MGNKIVKTQKEVLNLLRNKNLKNKVYFSFQNKAGTIFNVVCLEFVMYLFEIYVGNKKIIVGGGNTKKDFEKDLLKKMKSYGF